MFREFPVSLILTSLQRDALLPAILFRTSRRQCDEDIQMLLERQTAYISEYEQRCLVEQIQNVMIKYDMPEDLIKNHPQYSTLINCGVGAHHAGQLLMWRLLLEELMSRSVLKLMIATGTVAAGVDFPARTVIITAHSKRGNDGFKVLTSTEFQQMSGRAGRRGKDSVGICLIAPSQFCDARVIAEVSKKPPEPLRSAYFASPSTVLNLLKFRSTEEMRFTVEKSLASFLDRKSASGLRQEAKTQEQEVESAKEKKTTYKKAQKKMNRLMRDAEILESKQLTLLDHALVALDGLGYIEHGKLTEKGKWAAELYTSLVLELAEAIESHLFYDLDIYELAGLVASISGDPHRVYLGIRKNPIKKEYFERMKKIVERVGQHYKTPTNQGVAVMPNAAVTVVTWMESQDWGEFSALLRLAGVAEGDAARLLTQTADHLNQLSRLTIDYPELAQVAVEARKAIMKPPLLETMAVE